MASLVAEQLAERADHPRRQVVDAEVPAVLERGDRLRLARAGVAGDHHEIDPGDRFAFRRCEAVDMSLARLTLARPVKLLVNIPRELARDPGHGLQLLLLARRNRSGEPK